MMPLCPYILLLFFFCTLVPTQVDAAGQVNGSVLFGAGQYRAEVEGKEVDKVSSQYGQVSLDYGLQGQAPRLGKYTLLLGYEFNILNPTITHNGVTDPAIEQIKTDKILYQGEILVAPGGLPFRLNAYARDIKRSSFMADGYLPSLPVGLQGAGQRQNRASLLSPDIFTDISNGTTHEIGGTLIIGIRNGSYLGNYRDVLSQLPRLLIDYKEREVTDLAFDSNQQHSRDRDLAFISLNKKDNWIHYRVHDYVDFLDSTQNFEVKQVLLGTVDHLLARRWINLTNWIKISGDLSYTEAKKKNEEFPENTHRVNLFAVAQRQEFTTSVFSSFERITEGERLTQELDIPLYFNYEPNRDSHYRGSLSGNYYRQSVLDNLSLENSLSDRTDLTFDLGSEFFRTRAIVFKPFVTLGFRENNDSQGVNEKLRLEWSNRRVANNSLPWTAGYYLLSTQTSNDTNSSVYLEQSLYGDVEKSLSRALRIGLRAKLRYGNGQNDEALSSGVSDRVEISSGNSGISQEEADHFLLYSSRVFLEHSGKRFSNRLELIVEGISSAVDNLTSAEVRHELQMDTPLSKFSLTSSVSSGDNVSVKSINTEYSMEPSSTFGADLSWSSEANYSYAPDRSLLLNLVGRLKGFSQEGREDVTLWLGSEKLEYRFYNRRGIVRKFAEIAEELGIEGGSGGILDREQTLFLRIMAAIYPTRSFYAKVASEIVMFSPADSEQVTLNAETGANFEKLQIAFSYGRGYKTAEGDLPKVEEDRWAVKVRKTF